MYNTHVHMYIHVAVDPLPCSEILRVVFIGMKYAVTLREWQDFEVQRDFEEIWYAWPIIGGFI